MKLGDLFEEDIYRIPDQLTLVIQEPWRELSSDSKSMLQNLANALKLSPAPRILYLNKEELLSMKNLPTMMVLFGHQIDQLKPHLPSKLNGSNATLTLPVAQVAADPEVKKELWGAIRLMISQVS